MIDSELRLLRERFAALQHVVTTVRQDPAPWNVVVLLQANDVCTMATLGDNGKLEAAPRHQSDE